MLKDVLAELDELERIIHLGGAWLDARAACRIDGPGGSLPVHVVTLGSTAPDAPAVGFFGGVHGLERIGTDVVLAFLAHLVARLDWDESLHSLLKSVRLVFMPIVNPGGMRRGTRANPGGVDLMRNAPLDAVEPVPFLVGGQRISAGLPWFRGVAAAPMEVESQALCDVVTQELLPRAFSMALDCHSGFGLSDRIWFPYAHTRRPMSHLGEVHALRSLLFRSHSHCRYLFEPQSHHYLTHGDLWDMLHLQAERAGQGVFLPFTLEMGSWLWIKKNPRQLFSRRGIFNPLVEHRQQRVMREHLAFLDFLVRAAASWTLWLPKGAALDAHRQEARERWY